MKMRLVWLLIFSSFQICRAYTSVDLGELEWRVTSGSQDIEVPATVPGGIYTDLQRAGVLNSGPFYYRSNDEVYRWVSYDNWTYSTEFNVDLDLYDHDNVVLECKGLDTVATTHINSLPAASIDNMFRRYSIPIKDLLVLGSNTLSIHFESPVSYSQRKYDEQLDQIYLVPPECNQQISAECHANHIRKMQASFSWDWGPAFPSMGIYQPISLEAYTKAVVRYVKWNTFKDNNDWTCRVDLIFDVDPDLFVVSGLVFLTLDGVRREYPVILVPSIDTPNEATTTLEFTIPQSSVDLWWPNESGEQTLYDLEVVFQDDAFSDISTMNVRVGFRTLELIQEPLVQGLTYKFRVNDVEMFMKGSNWIPAHVLPEQVSREYIFDLLTSAKEAHMNMLRIWGGGIYEPDVFYEIADELGIFIWQDHMFACSLYQANQENLTNADLESQHQIRRLQHHASLALWAGNNENEAALRQNWYGTNDYFERYYEDYVKLYVDTIMRRVQIEDPGKPFLLSSPNNGDQTINEGFVALDPQSPIYGDMHHYNYDRDNWDYTTYPNTRFASEYGFQSFPSFEILETVSDPSDWSLNSEFMFHRQRKPNATNDLLWQIQGKMDLPTTEELDTVEGFKEFLYLAQIFQAVSLKVETEHYRRGRSRIDPVTGEGNCMGTMYWQLNDIWPAASWTSIEHGGKWKVSHYYVEQMFREVILSPILNAQTGQFEVHLISDSRGELVELTLEVSVMRWDSFAVTFSEEIPIASFPAQTSDLVLTRDMMSLLESGGCSGEDGIVRTEHCLILVRLSGGNLQMEVNNYWSSYVKEALGLSVPSISIESVTENADCGQDLNIYPSCFDIDIVTDQVSPFVVIEALGIPGHFDDNGFLMSVPTRQIKLFSKDPNANAQTIINSLQIRSYKNSFLRSSKEFKKRNKPSERL